jgi:hypothetical protein
MSQPLTDFFRHHGAWAPGVRLFRRLQFPAKAMIILGVMLVPVGLLGWNYFGDKTAAIGFTAKERVGVQYARVVLPLVLQAQQLRAEPGHAGAASDYEAQLRKLDEVEARLGAQLDTAKAVAALKSAQPAPQADWMKAYEAQSTRVNAALALLTQVADGSNLTLDPDLDSYYLMDAVFAALPTALDATARLRDLATAKSSAAIGGSLAERELARAEALGDAGDERWARKTRAARCTRCTASPARARRRRRSWRRPAPRRSSSCSVCRSRRWTSWTNCWPCASPACRCSATSRPWSS